MNLCFPPLVWQILFQVLLTPVTTTLFTSPFWWNIFSLSTRKSFAVKWFKHKFIEDSLLAEKNAKRLHSVHSILAVITGSDYSSSDSWSKAFWELESEAVHFLRPISMSPICLPSHHFEDLERTWAQCKQNKVSGNFLVHLKCISPKNSTVADAHNQ